MKRFLILLALLAVLSPCVNADAPRYLLRAQNGMICAFDLQTNMCLHTGRAVCSLPNEADRALLEKGLLFSDRQSLTSALEDFCS